MGRRDALRVFATAAVWVALAGCASPPPATPTVEPDSFANARAPWLALASGGCVACGPFGGLGPEADHHALFVFQDGGVLLIEFNRRDGAMGLVAHDAVAFDRGDLARLLANVPRAEGEAWVVRVATARVGNAALPDLLVGAWVDAPGGEFASMGEEYALRQADGTIHRRREPVLHVEDDPFATFARMMDELRVAMLNHGVSTGAPRP